MKRLLLVLALLCLCLVPAFAQEPTAEAPVDGTEVVIVDAEPRILSLTLGELLGIVAGLGALAVAIGKVLWDANQNPGGASVDERLTERVGSAHTDREWVMKLERAYELGQGQAKTAIDALTSVLSTIAPLTPLKVDDAALNLLKDIQTPGVMAQETPYGSHPAGKPLGTDYVTTSTHPTNITDVHGTSSEGDFRG